MSGLRKDLAEFSHLLLLSLLQYIVFVEVQEENPASHNGNWKRKGILIVFRIIMDILYPTPNQEPCPVSQWLDPKGLRFDSLSRAYTSVAGTIPCISFHQ